MKRFSKPILLGLLSLLLIFGAGIGVVAKDVDNDGIPDWCDQNIERDQNRNLFRSYTPYDQQNEDEQEHDSGIIDTIPPLRQQVDSYYGNIGNANTYMNKINDNYYGNVGNESVRVNKLGDNYYYGNIGDKDININRFGNSYYGSIGGKKFNVYDWGNSLYGQAPEEVAAILSVIRDED